MTGLAVTALASTTLAVAPAGADQQVPTGPDVRLTYPAGDIHVDRGHEESAALRRASDVTGIRLAWPREGLKVEVTFAGEPLVATGPGEVYYSADVYLFDHSVDDGLTVSLSWDGEDVDMYRYGSDFSREPLDACGATGARSGATVTFNLPTACLDGVKTFWASASAGWRDFTDEGDHLDAGDIGLHETHLDAIVHEVGTSPRSQKPYTGGSAGSTSTSDRDSSAGRIEWVDATGDSSADSGTDITRVTAEARSDGTTKWVIETTKGMTDEALSFWLSGDHDQRLSVRSTVWNGTRTTDATYSERVDWGTRACSATLDTSGTSVIVTTAADCGAYDSFDFGTMNLTSSSNGVFTSAGDAVYGPISFTRPVPAKPATRGRDVSDTCDGRSAKTRFSDTGGNVHAAMIDCLSSYDITQGKGGGQYGAKDPLSRGQVATFLKKTLEAAGRTVPPGDGACAGKVHGDSLDAMVAAGIMAADGCDVTSRMTRSDMAQATADALTWAGKSPTGAPDYFHDDVWMRGDLQPKQNAIAHAGIVTGKGVGVFAPEEQLRRDQMATFLARLLDTLTA